MRDIYDVITANGGNVIGRCDDNGEYDYCESRSVVDGKFVGLPLDEDNQSNMTKTRVISWLEQISKECSSCCGSCG
ncbi:MAG: hypothetical protein D6B27_12765 [Gammaproteobacteria bacterium]|nr:MAG: hypothetical protein D6B27_12765 [Gammaproteobacteria bacterium]